MHIPFGQATAGSISATRNLRRKGPFFTKIQCGRIYSSAPLCNPLSPRFICISDKWKMPSQISTQMKMSFDIRRGRTTRFSTSGRDTKEGSRTLSRTERRLLERKERNRAKRASRKLTIDQSSEITPKNNFLQMLPKDGISSFFSKSKGFQKLIESLIPRVPGRNVSFTHHSLFVALALRLPFFLAISYVITNENTSPFVVQGSLGPSMLPTIQFVGDVWLVETGAWRWVLRLIDGENMRAVRSIYEVGDLVIWEDPRNGKRSCKRIVGLEGDTINRFGEYRDLYRNRSDVGILWPNSKDEGNKEIFGFFSRDDEERKAEADENGEEIVEHAETIVVPKQCVWLEGDCPLLSMDSRQYGPIHSSKIRGRLVFRLWPWNRDDLANDPNNVYLSSCLISKKRPVPYSSVEAYIGKRFGLYSI